MRVKPFSQRPVSVYKACSIGTLIPDITKQAFKKYGFYGASILIEWPVIVGNDLAAKTLPDRLKWPKIHSRSREYSSQCNRKGATLILRTKPSHALDIQYQSSDIKDRINSYFGYHAVSQIRILQAPISEVLTYKRKTYFQKQVAILARSNDSLSNNGDFNNNKVPGDDLEYALTRLEQNIRIKNQSH
ncbi:MAG: hypothetical protein TECD_01068 [Hyphomicrobiaceae bacterium hypho_1]